MQMYRNPHGVNPFFTHTQIKNISLPQMAEIIIYTDGAALGNPGPGGYGAVMIYGQHRKELSDGFVLTTNNRMLFQSYNCLII